MTQQRILVVEDDPDGQTVMSHVLNFLDAAVDIANTAEEACHFLFEDEHDYNAIVIDLALPGMDGWQLLDLIQNNPRTAQFPCVAVTAYHTSQVKEQAIQAGFAIYIPKPIHVPSLAQTLTTIME